MTKYRIDLQPRDILQINATIIAGAFIFLRIIGTVSSSAPEVINESRAVTFSLLIIIIFSASSISLFFGEVMLSTTVMIAGFGSLLIFSIMLPLGF